MTRVFSSDEEIDLVELSDHQAQMMAENLEIFEAMINDHLHMAYRFNLNKGSFQYKTIEKMGYLAQASLLLPLYGPVVLKKAITPFDLFPTNALRIEAELTISSKTRA